VSFINRLPHFFDSHTLWSPQPNPPEHSRYSLSAVEVCSRDFIQKARREAPGFLLVSYLSSSWEDVNRLFGNGLAVEAGFSHVAESNNTVGDCKKSVVFSDLYTFSSFNLGATLANDDLASFDFLSIRALHTKVLWL